MTERKTAMCHARIDGTQNLCTAPKGHTSPHRCLAADVDDLALRGLAWADANYAVEPSFTPFPEKVPYGTCATGKHPIGSQPVDCDECEIARNAAR